MTAAADLTCREYCARREDEIFASCNGDTPRAELRRIFGVDTWRREWDLAIWDRVYRERGTLTRRVWASLLRCGWRLSDIARVHGYHCQNGGPMVAAVVALVAREVTA